MVRLFDIAAQIEALLNASVDPDTGEVREEALAELDALETARDEKALAVAAYLLGQEAEADAIDETAKRLRARAQVHRNHAERLRRYLADHLPAGTKLADARVKIGWRKSRAVRVVEPEKLPEPYWRVVREVDKRAVGDALKSGAEVPGCELEDRLNLVVK